MNNNVLFNIGYGLYVLTANEGEKDNGCIINTVMQVTSDPLQIAIAVNKKNYTNEMIQRTKKFNVSILSESAKFEIFEHFGFHSGRDTDKFASFYNDRYDAFLYEGYSYFLVSQVSFLPTLFFFITFNVSLYAFSSTINAMISATIVNK